MLFGSAWCLCTIAKIYDARGINILIFKLSSEENALSARPLNGVLLYSNIQILIRIGS